MFLRGEESCFLGGMFLGVSGGGGVSEGNILGLLYGFEMIILFCKCFVMIKIFIICILLILGVFIIILLV